MKTTAAFVLDDESRAVIDAAAARLRSSKSYALRALLLAHPSGELHAGPGNLAGDHHPCPRAGDGGDNLTAPGVAPSVAGGASAGAGRARGVIPPGPPTLSTLTDMTMEFQNRHNERQRAARLREAQAKDEAVRKAAELTEAARREGNREAAEIEQREATHEQD